MHAAGEPFFYAPLCSFILCMETVTPLVAGFDTSQESVKTLCLSLKQIPF